MGSKGKVLVTGAAGFVGKAVATELLSAGYEVRALCKATTNVGSLKELPLELFRGDITDANDCLAACNGVEVVFHIAALFRQAKFPDSEYYRVNRDGTQNLIDAALKCNVRRFIHCSTLGVHGDIPNPPADEQQPYAPCDIYQESKVAAEEVVFKAVKERGLEATVIRPAMIWGPGDRRLFKLYKGVKHGFPLIGDGKQLCHWILVDDLARAFRLAAEAENTSGKAYIVAGERPVTLAYTLKVIAATYGVKLPFFRIPVTPLYLLGAVCELVCLPFGIEPPIFRRRVAFFMKSRAYVTKKAEQELGFKAKYSVEDEIKYIASWYAQAGWL